MNRSVSEQMCGQTQVDKAALSEEDSRWISQIIARRISIAEKIPFAQRPPLLRCQDDLYFYGLEETLKSLEQEQSHESSQIPPPEKTKRCKKDRTRSR